MSLYEYLELQPIDPQEDGSVSELDTYKEDDTIDLFHEVSGAEIVEGLTRMVHDVQMEELDDAKA